MPSSYTMKNVPTYSVDVHTDAAGWQNYSICFMETFCIYIL